MRSWKRRTRALRNKAERRRASRAYKFRYSIVGRILKEYAAGSNYFESCNYHPCKIDKLRGWTTDGDIEGTSLVNGRFSSCSLTHCGVTLMSEREAFERRDFILAHGMLPYEVQYIRKVPLNHPKDRLIKGIRGSITLDLQWGFNSKQQTSEITDAGKAWLLETYGVDYDTLTPLSEEEMNEDDE